LSHYAIIIVGHQKESKIFQICYATLD